MRQFWLKQEIHRVKFDAEATSASQNLIFLTEMRLIHYDVKFSLRSLAWFSAYFDKPARVESLPSEVIFSYHHKQTNSFSYARFKSIVIENLDDREVNF